MLDTLPGSATALADDTDFDDEFSLDVRVVVAASPMRRGDCPTDDGCGTTCSTNNSACSSFTDDPA